jgi:hypothetical protein
LRSVQFTLFGDKTLSGLIRFKHSVHIWFDLLRAFLFKIDPKILLNKRF